jgi:hypothetical protein
MASQSPSTFSVPSIPPPPPHPIPLPVPLSPDAVPPPFVARPPGLVVSALKALGILPGGPGGEEAEASVRAALLAAATAHGQRSVPGPDSPDSPRSPASPLADDTGLVSPEAAVAALAAAGLKLSKCRAYHLCKAMGRRTLGAPLVVHRGPDSLTLHLQGYRESEDVGAVALVLGVRLLSTGGTEAGGEVEHGLPAAGGSLVTHTLWGLGHGVEVALRVRARTSCPALDACLGWSPVCVGKTLRPPRAPRAPVVVAVGPTSLTLDLHNPGAVSDPPGVALVVECGGVETKVAVGGDGGASGDTIRHVLSGLPEGTLYSLRCKCIVGDDALDAAATWSPATTTTTSTAVLERVLAQQVRTLRAGLSWLGAPLSPWVLVSIGRFVDAVCECVT